jgi:cyclic pyranopterin phosphate synthase
MGDINFWKILRVLTTNTCNYQCTFCHNEGQEKPSDKRINLQFDDYKIIIDSLESTPLKEVHFSGGEPFMNPETLKMILYTNDTTDFELGCATNTTFLSEETIKQLANTRIKLNIQFPAIKDTEFTKITKSGDLSKVLGKIELLKKYNVEFGLNHVLQSDSLNSIDDIIDFVTKNGLSIKLLPDLSNTNSVHFKNSIFPFLDSIAIKKIDKGTGALKWWISDSNNAEVAIMYIDSPCFNNDINTCKRFSEVRLLPSLNLQTCIRKNELIEFDFEIIEKNKSLVVDKFQESWKSFTRC